MPGKKISPVVLVESISGIMPERRLRRTTGSIACVAVAPSASVASIRARRARTSSPSRLSATAAAVIELPTTMPPTGTRKRGFGSKTPSATTSTERRRAGDRERDQQGPEGVRHLRARGRAR